MKDLKSRLRFSNHDKDAPFHASEACTIGECFNAHYSLYSYCEDNEKEWINTPLDEWTDALMLIDKMLQKYLDNGMLYMFFWLTEIE